MKRGGLTLLVALLVLACAMGGLATATLLGHGPSPQYRAALETQRLETHARMAALKVVFWYVLAGIALLFLAGLTIALLRLLWQRSQLIRPNASGLFPVVRGRAGGQILRPGSGYIFYHDPNRQLAGTVVYGRGSGGLEMRQLLPAGAEAEPFGVAQDRQLQVTTQAQAAQVVAAAGQGRGMSGGTRRLVERLTESRPAPRLPAVVVGLDETISEERRLLAAIRAGVEAEVEA